MNTFHEAKLISQKHSYAVMVCNSNKARTVWTSGM